MSELDKLHGFLMSLEPTDGRAFALDQVASLREEMGVLYKTVEELASKLAEPAPATEQVELGEWTSAIVEGGYELYCGLETYFYANRVTYEAACLNAGIEPLPASDLTTQEPQEEDSGADDVVEGLKEAVSFAQSEPEPVANTNGADLQSEIIDATEEVTDEAVEASVDPETNSGGGIIGASDAPKWTTEVTVGGYVIYKDEAPFWVYKLDEYEIYNDKCDLMEIQPVPKQA